MDGTQLSNVNKADFGVINSVKDKKSSEMIQTLEKKSTPAHELTETGKFSDGFSIGFPKCGPATVDPEMFNGFFGVDHNVEDAKKIVNNIVKATNKGDIADGVKDFYEVVNKMDKHDLIETAQFLAEKMSKTDGSDEVLGSLLHGVLNELQSRDNKLPQGLIDLLGKLPPGIEKIEPPICVFPKLPFDEVPEPMPEFKKPFLKY